MAIPAARATVGARSTASMAPSIKMCIRDRSYGNPVVAGGQVYAGTNNELVRNPKETGDRGVLMCFRESDGKFLWQQANVKLAAGRALDWPFQGVCSSPLVEGDRLYYCLLYTSRCV